MRDNSWLNGCYSGEEVYVIGGGPSLRGFDFGRLRGKRTIVTNSQFFDCHAAGVVPDLWVFVDADFCRILRREFGFEPYNVSGTRILAGPASSLYSKDNVWIFHYSKKVSRDPKFLFSPGSSGHSGLCAINAALISGASKIYLLGIDLCFDGNRSHHDSAARPHKHDDRKHEYKYRDRVEDYESFTGPIFNLSPISALKAYPRADVDLILPKNA